MTTNYSLTIAGYDSLQKGVFHATNFHDKIQLVFLKDGQEIQQASLAADRLSLSRTLEITLEKIELFCERLGIEENDLSYDRSELSLPSRLIYKLLFLKKIAFEAFVPAQWVIVYKKENDAQWKKIIPSPDVFQADPFLIFKDNKYYVFYEELKFEDWHGYLRVAELDIETNCLINDKIILNLDYHLSFPNVFEEDGTFYMIPECGDSNSVDLFECTSFPYEWTKKKTLIGNTEAVDTVPLKKDDTWYLFTTEIIKGADCNDELSIYKSDSLLNQPFEKLYQHPVISDVTNARMGGHFICRDNEVFRVSQNCGKRYGFQANINKVIQIEGGYKEELVDTIKPSEGALGFHTYNQAGELVIGDMEIKRLDFVSLNRFVGGNFRKIFRKLLGK